MKEIEVSHLTKDYGHQRGVFDVSFEVEEGQCFGFLGPNGAGKTTTIRHLMGFSKAEQGKVEIQGKACWENASYLQHVIGYLPGEIALPESMTGTGFLKYMAKIRGVTEKNQIGSLLKRYELNPDLLIGQMSLGMKRKLSVVNAFLHDPKILILDEPTSGLDPMMQDCFLEHMEEEKKKGKTIFLSSHFFHEVEVCCDKVAIIKEGKLVSQFEMQQFLTQSDKVYQVTFESVGELEAFLKTWNRPNVTGQGLTRTMPVKNGEVQEWVQKISEVRVQDFSEVPFTLEQYFMQFYETSEKVDS